MTPADAEWLPAVERRLGRPLTVTARVGLAGGYVAESVVRVDLDGAPPVVVKRTTRAEVAALRALAVVRDVEHPRLLAAGGDWVVTPYYDGVPLAEGPHVPGAFWVTLARVHAHWLRRRPRGLPVTDGAWWRHLCVGRIAPHVRAAGERTGERVFVAGARALGEWAGNPPMHAALSLLPRTLTHGDPHRGNILTTANGPVLIDWGNARVAPPGFDLAVLRAQGATDLTAYRATFAERAGAPPAALLAVEQHCADAYAHVGYLGFAADHQTADRVADLLNGATRALAALSPALDAYDRR